VTSNYRYDLAPYTWELVQGLKAGRRSSPSRRCRSNAPARRKRRCICPAMHWHRKGALKDIDIQFMNAGGVLFGVKDYVPALMEYIEKYGATLNFFHNLVAVDGPAKKATFRGGQARHRPSRRSTVEFDMMHVCPPQTAPDFIRVSPLADAAGWVDVDQATLRHKTYDNIWSLGDVMNAPNAKTAAAARKQAPTVADNVVADIGGAARPPRI
jgi:sulfide:quinone oxidoreductase